MCLPVNKPCYVTVDSKISEQEITDSFPAKSLVSHWLAHSLRNRSHTDKGSAVSLAVDPERKKIAARRRSIEDDRGNTSFSAMSRAKATTSKMLADRKNIPSKVSMYRTYAPLIPPVRVSNYISSSSLEIATD